MSGADIAGIIAAAGFVLLVLFLAVPLIKLGGVLDETRESIRDLSRQTSPLLSELTETVQEANKQLAKIDVITTNVADVSSNVSSLVAVFASTIGSPLVKLAGLTKTLTSALMGKKK
jgi:uncharacterized protein YoxC